MRQVSRLTIGQFESFWQALRYRGCSMLSDTWPWGDEGQGIVAQSVRDPIKELVGAWTLDIKDIRSPAGKLFIISSKASPSKVSKAPR